jgi:ribosomal protein S18 acetylase RimI-like enzyme
MDVTVRAAERSDVEAIRTVARAAWFAAHEPIVGTEAVEQFLDEHYDPASFRERIEADRVVLDVATDADDRVMGYLVASPSTEDDGTFDLSQIYVDPDRWGEGVGRRLLDRVERTVDDRDGERIRLGVMAENDRAVGFYEAAGYERVDEFYDDRIDARSYVYEKGLQ